MRPRVDFFRRRTTFILRSPDGPYGVQAGFFPVRELERAFAAAGFELIESRPLLGIFPRPPF